MVQILNVYLTLEYIAQINCRALSCSIFNQNPMETCNATGVCCLWLMVVPIAVGNKLCFTGPELIPLAPRRDDAGQAAVVGPFYRSIGKVIKFKLPQCYSILNV